MRLSEYIIMFVLVLTMGAGVPGAGDASLLAAGAFWIGAYVIVSYFLGAKIARSIGDAGSMTILGVVVIVAAGLIIRAGLAKWRTARPARP
jgi:membrane protein DedA with SNARE-associated domain